MCGDVLLLLGCGLLVGFLVVLGMWVECLLVFCGMVWDGLWLWYGVDLIGVLM